MIKRVSTTSILLVLLSLTIYGQHHTLTLSEKAPLLLELNLESEEIGSLEKGTVVEALACTGLTYQIKTADGKIGWVPYEYFEESKELVIEPFNDTPVGFYKRLNEHRWVGEEKIRDFQAGEIVTYLEGFEEKGFLKVRDQSGEIGFTTWQRARPALEDLITEYEQLDYLVVLESKIENEVINQPLETLIALAREPHSQIIDAQGNGFMFYRKLYLVKDGERFGHIRFLVENNLIMSFESQNGPNSFWIENMPLATWIRSLEFGIEFQKIQGLDIFPSTGEMSFFLKWGWRILWFITIVLFFSIPHFITTFLVNRYAYRKALSNIIVHVLHLLTFVLFFYTYYLFIGLHMIHEEHWFLAVTFVLIGFFSYKIIHSRLLYHRCPDCNSYFETMDKGSEIVGKTHVTEHKHQDVYRGTRETSTAIVKEYDRHHYTEKSTELDISDHRECTACGATWIVKRIKTVRGHT